jgi:glucose/arabinose dehydrogenase
MTTRTLVGLTIALIVAITQVPAAAIQLDPVLSGLSSPLSVTNAGDLSNRLFVLERGGVLKVLQPGSISPTVFLDITARVLSGAEQGLLGLAFHPQFVSNRRFFVNYTRRADDKGEGGGDTVIAEYQASVGDPNIAGPARSMWSAWAAPCIASPVSWAARSRCRPPVARFPRGVWQAR